MLHSERFDHPQRRSHLTTDLLDDVVTSLIDVTSFLADASFVNIDSSSLLMRPSKLISSKVCSGNQDKVDIEWTFTYNLH